MPITPPQVTGAILLAGPTLKGPTWARIAAGVGVGVVAWTLIPGNVVVAGVTTGTVGSGVVNGKVVIPPVPLPVVASTTATALLGPVAPQMAAAVGIGVGTSYSATATYVGASVGAIGADVSKVTFANPATLIASLSAAFAATGMVGPTALRWATALGPGIAGLFMLGGGAGVSVGAGGPSFSVGGSVSTIV